MPRSSKWDSGEANGRTVKGASGSRGHSLKQELWGQSEPIKHERLGGFIMTPPSASAARCVVQERERDGVKRERGLWDTV